MDSIRKTADLVKDVLEREPKTRNSDTYLYYVICKERLKIIGLDINEVSLADALVNQKTLKLPNFETVGRCRRKLQNDFEHLRGTKDATTNRLMREADFRNFARGV